MFKAMLRRHMMAIRNSIEKSQRQEYSNAIMERLFASDEYRRADSLFFFCGYSSEVETLRMIERAIKEGKRVGAPRVLSKSDMAFFEVSDTQKLVRSDMGILEPLSDGEKLKRADIVLLPGLAFDIKGGRLGYGRGYYDRYLKAMPEENAPIKAALAFECQIVDEVPMTEDDERADIIFTEKRKIYIPK